MLKILTAAAAMLLVCAGAEQAQAAQAGSAATAPAEIRFCPATARSYPLDSLRGVQGLLVHNIALVNRGTAPAEVAAVRIELIRGGAVQDVRILEGADLAAAVRSGQAVAGAGMLELLAFQFCDGRLLGGARPGESITLAPNQALLVMQQVFAWRGDRDTLRVSATLRRGGRSEETSASIAIEGAPSRTVFRWPLRRGPWLVGSGASFHTTHRWAIPEQFALDIIAVGGNGRTYSGTGTRNRDFRAYDAEVVAAADGRVVRLVTGAAEAPPMLRRAGETPDAYYARIGERQAVNIAAGEAGLLGDAIVIDHGNGEFSVYAHLVPRSIRVRMGESVRAGQPIARLGSSGNSTEPHLHFQVCDAPSGVSCAGIAPRFTGIALPAADGPRPIQSGDLVIAEEPPR